MNASQLSAIVVAALMLLNAATRRRNRAVQIEAQAANPEVAPPPGGGQHRARILWPEPAVSVTYDDLVSIAQWPRTATDQRLEIERQGAVAFEAGLLIEHCPYTASTFIEVPGDDKVRAVLLWARGWKNAKMDASTMRSAR